MASDTTTFNWYYDLVEYAMTTDVTNDYIAKVKTANSITIEDIASSIAADRTDLREDTIIMVANLIADKVRQYVCQGNTVVTGVSVLKPTITGTFTGSTGNFGDNNACKVSISPCSALRDDIDEVTPIFTGNVKSNGGAYIGLVTDRRSGLTDGTITPGGAIVITGTKIKCLAADGETAGVVRFTNIETNEETVVDTGDFVSNNPSEVVVIVPSTLTSGTYNLTIETYFSNNSTMLKEARVITYDQTLTVAASE